MKCISVKVVTTCIQMFDILKSGALGVTWKCMKYTLFHYHMAKICSTDSTVCHILHNY